MINEKILLEFVDSKGGSRMAIDGWQKSKCTERIEKTSGLVWGSSSMSKVACFSV